MLNPKRDKVLIVYKKSLFEIYFGKNGNRLPLDPALNLPELKKKLKLAHKTHNNTLRRVLKSFQKLGFDVKLLYRARRYDYTPYRLVVTVGGDGTVMEAARGVTNQLLLAINSDPVHSVGKLCSFHASELNLKLTMMMEGRATLLKSYRIQLSLNGVKSEVQALNDVLICHLNPAAMSRYSLSLGKDNLEEQKSSGLWVCTAAGSTGAMASAGGVPLKIGSKKIQYKPRELFTAGGAIYQNVGGLTHRPIEIVSHMREGRIYMDGAHFFIPFPYGTQLVLSSAPSPLQLIRF